MRVKSGDIVKVIAGNNKVRGTVAKVVSVDRKTDRVVLENGPTHKKHLKPERSRRHPEGGRVDLPASIHISNVMLMPEGSERPVRVGWAEENGQKIRVARGRNLSGEKV